MKRNLITVLKIINDKLKNENIKWVIGGSASLLLQGIVNRAHDVDILTDKKDAIRICNIFKEYETKPVKFGKTKIISSYRGQLKIKNITIDVMGELSEKFGNKWINIYRQRMKSYKFVKINGIKLPVSMLESHLESYKNLKRKKDIVKIKRIEKALHKIKSDRRKSVH